MAETLDELLAGCLRGADPAGALERACGERPGEAGELRRRFALLQDLGLGDLCQEAESHPAPRRFGDFELGEVLGVGGMGVVHRARQRSLDREVVVKLVRPDLCHFPSTRERFRREAEAVARLQHPGIVPVHVVGEHEGVPFFAMESVDGLTLAECLRDLAGRAPETLTGADLAPGCAGSWVHACLSVAREVANALQHAASRGVLHRDVKPSNVLVTAEGRARLIDFGLHVLVETEDGDERLTREGSAPGTLLYMPPEQLERGRYDARSEVYALGATLYELLTLHPPFHGDTRSDTERRIRAGLADPIQPRNRKVSSDVDAVVQRSLAPEPGRRYASMAAFADDLERLLAGRPVAARPDGMAYKVRRWIGREPALAGAIGVGLVLAIAAPLWVIVQQRAHNRELLRLVAEEQAAREESDDLARLLGDLFEGVDPNFVQPTEASLMLLANGVARLEERLVARPARLAPLLSSLGRVYGNLGQYAEGEALLVRAIEGFARLATPTSPAERKELALERAEARSRLANLLERANRNGESLPHREALVDRLAEAYGADNWQVTVARADLERVRSQETGEPPVEEVDEALRSAVAAVEAAPDARPRDLARVLGWHGTLLVGRAMPLAGPDSRPLFEEAAERLERTRSLLEEAGLGDTLEWANATNGLGLARKKLGDLAAARLRYLEADKIYRERVGPNDVRRAMIQSNLAGLAEASGALEEARARYEELRAILIAVAGPDARETVVTEGNLLGTLFRLGRLEGLAARYDALIPRQARWYPEGHPAVATSHQRRGMARALEGDVAGARDDFETALGMLLEHYPPGHHQVAEVRAALERLDAD